MNKLEVVLMNVLAFRDSETKQIRAIEIQNGHLERYDCELTNNTRTAQLFGVDTVPAKIKVDHE